MDITTTEITAGLAGTVTVGTLIMLILQNIKALVPSITGITAEVCGGVASLVAVAAAFELAGATWEDASLYLQLFISWMSAWVAARSTYSLLFHVSVEGIPIPPGAEAPLETLETNETRRNADV